MPRKTKTADPRLCTATRNRQPCARPADPAHVLCGQHRVMLYRAVNEMSRRWQYAGNPDAPDLSSIADTLKPTI